MTKAKTALRMTAQRKLEVYRKTRDANAPIGEILREYGLHLDDLRQIEATDRRIDALVYELYALTPAEIALVEGAGGFNRPLHSPKPAQRVSRSAAGAYGLTPGGRGHATDAITSPANPRRARAWRPSKLPVVNWP